MQNLKKVNKKIFPPCRIYTLKCVYKVKDVRIVQTKPGPVDWLEEKVKQHENKLLRTALAVVGNNADAEDIVQEAFVKLFQKQPVFESPNHETAWLIRITVNLCKNYLRSHWWKKVVPLLETHPAPEGEQQDAVRAVMALPPKYRTVIHLYYFEGYATKEIAEITEQKESTVRQLLTRARRKLKDFLEGDH